MGTAQVIPQLGGFVGAVPVFLVAVARQDEPVAAIALAAIYLIAVQVVKLAVGGRLGRDLNVRPALALPAFAVVSQIGLVWLLLSAPILVISRNTVVYLRGRFGEPPAPAGVLPWDARRRVGRAAAPAAVPPAYRSAGAPASRAPLRPTAADGAPTAPGARAASGVAAAAPPSTTRPSATSGLAAGAGPTA
jgi:hypothetical protein